MWVATEIKLDKMGTEYKVVFQRHPPEENGLLDDIHICQYRDADELREGLVSKLEWLNSIDARRQKRMAELETLRREFGLLDGR